MLNAVILVSVPILLLGSIALKYLTTAVENEVSAKNLLLSNSYASEIDRFLDGALHRLEHLAHLLEDGQFVSPEKLSDYLALAVAGDDDLNMVWVLDHQGIVTHVAPFDENIYGLDMSRQDYYTSAKERQSFYWSSVFISPQTGASTLTLTIPFKRGMVVGHLSLWALHEIVDSNKMGSGGYVAVVDRDGTAIAHHKQSLVAERSNLSNLAHITEGLAGHEGIFRYAADGRDQIGSVALIPGTRWVVAVSQPLELVFLPIKNLKRFLYAGTLSAIVIAVLVALFSLQKILSPLKSLTQEAQKIADGNYVCEPTPTSYNEIADLSSSFKAMIAQVGAREAALRKSEERFRTTFEQAAVGIAHISTEGRFLRINQKFCDIVGYTHDEMLKLTFQDITHPDDLDADLEHVRRLTAGEAETYTMEKRYFRKKGEIVWVNLTVSLLQEDKGTPRYFVSAVEDITDRKQDELTLQKYQQRLKALASQLTLAEEKERRRIATDLHDHVGQSLALAHIQIAAACKSATDAGLTAKLDDISETLREAVQDTRHLMFDLSAPSMHEIGLGAAISEWLEDQIEKRYGIKTEFFDNLDKSHRKVLDEDVRAILFRNVRELLINVVKHAQANQVTVLMEVTDGVLKIVVQDDGVGFDSRELSQPEGIKGGFGLFSIEERMTDLGGALEIESQPGKGGRAILTVPLVPKSASGL